MAAQGQGQAQGVNGDGEGQAQEGQGQDWGALTGRLDGLDTATQETRNALDQIAQSIAGLQPQQQEAEPQAQEQAPMDVDLSFLDPTDPSYDPQQAAQALTEQFGQMVERTVQQRLGPVQEAQEEQRRQWEAAQLTSEFPELADEGTAREVVQSAQQYAEVLAPTLGKDVARQLSNEPAFWRLIYAAGRSFDAAQQEEGSGDPGAAHLEGGGGANPSGATQVDPGDLIVQAGQGGRSVLPF